MKSGPTRRPLPAVLSGQFRLQSLAIRSDAASYVDRIHGGSTYVIDLIQNAGGKEQPFGSSYEVSGYLNSYRSRE